MRLKLGEFLYELGQDRNRKVLFVEGLRDLAFWRGLVTTFERGDTVIYPVSQIDCPNVEGGERGRLVYIAAEIRASPYHARVRFFADADTDRMLKIILPDNIILTDGRDLEAYGILAECIGDVCVAGFARENESSAVLDLITRVCRPIGVIRVASARKKWRLGFQKTLAEKGFRRLVDRTQPVISLDGDRLLTTLLQNSGVSISRKAEIVTLIEQETTALGHLPDFEVVHGKDLINALSAFFDRDGEHIETLLFMSIQGNLGKIRVMPNIRDAETWVRGS